MLTSTPFTVSLRETLGDRFRVHPQECERFAIAGVAPKLVLSARTLDEAARAVKIVAAERASVVIRGSGTKSHRPPELREIDAVLDASDMRGILDHTPGDLTATVAAGTTMHELDFALSKAGQFFPCDAPFAASATLGGTLAANANGALRQRYGALRDNVLGMRVALSDGTVAFSGAKVVKSVAGYDIHKAFIGSYGTLGLIGEITIKVAPLPQSQRLLVAAFRDPAQAVAASNAIARSSLFVLATTLHDAQSIARVGALRDTTAEWTLIVRCGGARSAAAVQFDRAAAMCKETGATMLRDLGAELVHGAWADVAELAGGAYYDSERFVIAKLVALPAQTHQLIAAIRSSWPDSELSAHPSAGIVFAHIPTNSYNSPGALWKRCAEEGWTAIFISAPRSLADECIAPLPAHNPVKLQRRLKAVFDPAGAFDPGRYWGGI